MEALTGWGANLAKDSPEEDKQGPQPEGKGPEPHAAIDDEEIGLEEDVVVDADEAIVEETVPARQQTRTSPPRPWGGNRGNVSPEDLSPEELTPEMRWPPGSWVRVTDVHRHSTGEPIGTIAVGDVGQVTAALSQTLVVLFPTRDNRREVLHIDSIEAVAAPE